MAADDSAIAPGEALVFDAAATPHASFEVPAEDALARVRSMLRNWLGAPADEPAPATAAAAAAARTPWQEACAERHHGTDESPDASAFSRAPLLSERLLAKSHALLEEICALETPRTVVAPGAPMPPGDARGDAEAHDVAHKSQAAKAAVAAHWARQALATRVRDVLVESERFSLEMRCAALVVPETARPALGGTMGLALALLAWPIYWRRRHRRRAVDIAVDLVMSAEDDSKKLR